MKLVPGLPHLTVGSVYCIGRNYSKHAKEMGSSLPDQPLVFLKPASSIIGNGGTIQLPRQSREIHHEVELIIAIGREGKSISRANALTHIAGYGIGIDVTARDIQQQAKDQGHPWSVAKGFDTFAPISRLLPIQPDMNFNAIQLSLTVNGQVRQHGHTRDMIFPVEELVAYLSIIFTLQPGDLIFTGTPKGVSAIQSGDIIRASLNDKIMLTVSANRDHDQGKNRTADIKQE